MTVPTYPAESIPPATATQWPAAGPPGTLAGARAQLLHDGSVEHYRRTIADGVDRVVRRVATVQQPGTGVAPADLAPVVDRVDLDRPLSDAGAALDEIGRASCRERV